jgi:signal transduction histidine kinase
MISRKNIYKLIAMIIPTGFIISSLIITSFLKESYKTTENELIQKETQFVSFELSENLKHDIMSKVSSLQTSAQVRPDIFPNDEAYFKKIVSTVSKNHPGFYAINWIDPGGTIRWVYPTPENLPAKDKKVIDRPGIRSYLEKSRDTESPMVSHVIDLYQGPKGMIIYVPIFHKGVFKGWYNGVIDIIDNLNNFFELRKLQNIHVTVKWKDHEDFSYSHGVEPISSSAPEIKFESQILNQTLIVSVNLNRDSILARTTRNLNYVFTLIYVSIGVIGIFLFYLIRSQFTFMYLNRTLSRDKILLNILTHDMATPLTLISENIKRLKDKLQGQSFPEIDRIMRSSAKQRELLTRVRSFHAANMGKIEVESVPVSTMEIITESLALCEQQMHEKQITYAIESPDGEIYGCADRITAINNVMGNVLNNAIKFSDNKSKIVIKTYKSKKYVVIETLDHGRGISDDILSNIFEEDEITSTRGTQGEAGTGLGMLQIKSFMELYRGKVKIETSESGTKVLLFFIATDL